MRPVWYYGERILVLALPWTIHLLAGAAAVVRPRRAEPEHRFGLGACLAGSLGTALLLTLFATKREVYLIPCLAFAAISVAYVVHRAEFPRLLRAGRWLVVVVFLVATLAAASLFSPVDVANQTWRRGRQILVEHAPGAGTWLAVVGAVTISLFVCVRLSTSQSRWIQATRVGAVGVIAAGILATHTLFPIVDPELNWSRAARAAEAAARGGPIDCWGIGQHGLVLWSLDRRSTRDLADDAQLAAALDPSARRGAVLAEASAWAAARERARSSTAPWARHLLAARETWRDRVGRRTVLVLTP